MGGWVVYSRLLRLEGLLSPGVHYTAYVTAQPVSHFPARFLGKGGAAFAALEGGAEKSMRSSSWTTRADAGRKAYTLQQPVDSVFLVF